MTPDIEKDRAAGTPTPNDIANGMNCPTEGYIFSCQPVRFLPYKPDGRRQRGKRGRWQVLNEYGGWENCADPPYIMPDFVDARTLTAANAALQERVAELEKVLETAVDDHEAHNGRRTRSDDPHWTVAARTALEKRHE